MYKMKENFYYVLCHIVLRNYGSLGDPLCNVQEAIDNGWIKVNLRNHTIDDKKLVWMTEKVWI